MATLRSRPQAAGSRRIAPAPASTFPMSHRPLSAHRLCRRPCRRRPRRADESLAAPAVDWDATLAFRRHLWGLGFKIAEAMDTSQRGLGSTGPDASELIARSLAEARGDRRVPTSPAASAPTSSIRPPRTRSTTSSRAYEEQLAPCRGAWRARHPDGEPRAVPPGQRADDYLDVYGRLIRQARDKVILHWLGEAFDPQLAGYWGAHELRSRRCRRCWPHPRPCRARSTASRYRFSTRRRSTCAGSCPRAS